MAGPIAQKTFSVKKNIHGKDGDPALTLMLNPSQLVFDTDTNGIVAAGSLSANTCAVKIAKGSEQVAPSSVTVKGVGCVAAYSGGVISVKSIDLDGKESRGSGYIDVTAAYNGKTYTARLYWSVNIHKVVTSLETKATSIELSVTEVKNSLKKDYMTKETTRAEIKELSDSISIKVSKETSGGGNLLKGASLILPSVTISGKTITPIDFNYAHATIHKGTEVGAHEGHTYVEINESGHTAGYGAAVALRAYVQKGKTYTYSAWIKTKKQASNDSRGVVFEVVRNTPDLQRKDHVTVQYPRTTKDGVWERFVYTFEYTNDEPIVECNIYLEQNGNISFSEIQLEEGGIATSWKNPDIEETLEWSGMEITPEGITLNGQRIFMKNGDKVAAMFKDGKMSTDLIDAKQIVTEGIQSQTIDAKNATFSNINISGSIDANSGNIAGFRIKDKWLISEARQEGERDLWGEVPSIAVKDDKRGKFAGIGNVMPAGIGLTAVARFENNVSSPVRNPVIVPNVAVYVSAAGNSASSNANSAMWIQNGTIHGFRRFLTRVKSDYTIKTTDCTLLVLDQGLTLTLPTSPEDGQEYKILQWRPVTIKTTDKSICYIDNGGSVTNKKVWTNNKTSALSAVYDSLNNCWFIFGI